MPPPCPPPSVVELLEIVLAMMVRGPALKMPPPCEEAMLLSSVLDVMESGAALKMPPPLGEELWDNVVPLTVVVLATALSMPPPTMDAVLSESVQSLTARTPDPRIPELNEL